VILKGGKRVDREWTALPKVSAVVTLLHSDRMILVRQYRYGVNKFLWEIPAGILDPGETPRACAKRECEEETGYRPGKLQSLGFYVTVPANTDATVYLYVASQLKKTAMCLDEDEVLTVKIFSLNAVKRMLKSGQIQDSKSIIALYRFFY